MQQTAISYKTLRKQRSLSLKEAGTLLQIDPTLLNRIENHVRKPTRVQLLKLAALYQLDTDLVLVDWLSDKLLPDLKGEKLAIQVLKALETKINV